MEEVVRVDEGGEGASVTSAEKQDDEYIVLDDDEDEEYDEDGKVVNKVKNKIQLCICLTITNFHNFNKTRNPNASNLSIFFPLKKK